MAISIGPKGFLDLVSTDDGPRRRVRIVSFTSPGDTGPIVHQMFDVGHHPAAIIDIDAGELVTSSFKTTVGADHSIRHQSDTGQAAALDGHTCWAVITDTGVAALT